MGETFVKQKRKPRSLQTRHRPLLSRKKRRRVRRKLGWARRGEKGEIRDGHGPNDIDIEDDIPLFLN